MSCQYEGANFERAKIDTAGCTVILHNLCAILADQLRVRDALAPLVVVCAVQTTNAQVEKRRKESRVKALGVHLQRASADKAELPSGVEVSGQRLAAARSTGRRSMQTLLSTIDNPVAHYAATPPPYAHLRPLLCDSELLRKAMAL